MTLTHRLQELMTRMFIVNIPFVFGAIWRVAQMLVDDRVKAKIRFLKHSELGQLYEFIDPDQLPVSLGGHGQQMLTDKSGKLLAQWARDTLYSWLCALAAPAAPS